MTRRDKAEAAAKADDQGLNILEEYDDRRCEREARMAAKSEGGQFITWRILVVGYEEVITITDLEDGGELRGNYNATAVYLRSVYRVAGVGVTNTDIRLA